MKWCLYFTQHSAAFLVASHGSWTHKLCYQHNLRSGWTERCCRRAGIITNTGPQDALPCILWLSLTCFKWMPPNRLNNELMLSDQIIYQDEVQRVCVLHLQCIKHRDFCFFSAFEWKLRGLLKVILRWSCLILCLLMSSMVKEEYSLSSWCSCWDWLLVRMPYIGTDTNWIWIWSSGDVSCWENRTLWLLQRQGQLNLQDWRTQQTPKQIFKAPESSGLEPIHVKVVNCHATLMNY